MAKPEEKEKPEVLPAKLRARMLESQDSMFFNVALFEHAQRVAEIFSQSTMVPAQFQKNLGNCLIALNYAGRIKADPFMTMQLMHVIHGRPGIEGKLVKALIEQSGKYRDVDYGWLDAKDNPIKKHEVVNDSKKDVRGCVLFGTDTKTGKLVTGPKVSWQIVHDEGWYNKNGSKWKTIPELMFMYRSASWFSNVHCPEVKLGMHTVEEIKDFVELEPGENGIHRVKEKTEEKLANLKDRLGDDTKEAPEDIEKEFEALTGIPLKTFKGLQDKGIKQFIENYNDKIVNNEWPEGICMVIKDKLSNKPEWKALLVYPPAKASTPKEDDSDDWNGLYYGCPDMNGKAIAKMKCKPENCDKFEGCPTPFKPGEVLS